MVSKKVKKQLIANDFEGFTSIGEHALSNKQLTSVELPNEIISIGDFSFFNNTITHFTFNKNLEHIGAHAFDHNELKQIILPNALKKWG